MKTENSVVDGTKLTDEQIGRLQKKLDKIKRRINEGTIVFQEAIDVLQFIVIEGKSEPHLGVIRGLNEIRPIEHIIDLDAAPFIPSGLSVEEHKKGGLLKWSPKLPFYWSKKQEKGSIGGHDLRKELDGKSVLNANVLDDLLAHQELIPEEWKGKYVFFWGTIYRDSDSRLCVRYLNWDGSRWYWYYRWLEDDFNSDYPAALAS